MEVGTDIFEIPIMITKLLSIPAGYIILINPHILLTELGGYFKDCGLEKLKQFLNILDVIHRYDNSVDKLSAISCSLSMKQFNISLFNCIPTLWQISEQGISQFLTGFDLHFSRCDWA